MEKENFNIGDWVYYLNKGFISSGRIISLEDNGYNVNGYDWEASQTATATVENVFKSPEELMEHILFSEKDLSDYASSKLKFNGQ